MRVIDDDTWAWGANVGALSLQENSVGQIFTEVTLPANKVRANATTLTAPASSLENGVEVIMLDAHVTTYGVHDSFT